MTARVVMDEAEWRTLDLRPSTFADGWWHGELESFTQFDGTVIEAGTIVWQQMYTPGAWDGLAHDANLRERIEHGRTYGLRRQMLLRQIAIDVKDGHPLVERSVKFCLFEPSRPNDDSQASWPNADWCYLERVVLDGMLW